jgi:hypothetical protein
LGPVRIRDTSRLAVKHRQSGAIGGVVVAALILVLFALFLARALSRSAPELEQDGRTRANLQKISDALVAFSSLNQRLPCPALGTNAVGDVEAFTGTTATCTDPAGVIPWVTLALRKEDALDGWGRKVSYRVYSGATGFTRAGGANMTNCNTDATAGGSPVATCDATSAHTTASADYFMGKGIAVTGSVTANSLAFVLVSHGSTGLGAYGAETSVRVLPTTTGDEWRNTQSTSPYRSNTRSDPSVPATDVNHFDDVVSYVAAADLVAGAKLGARAWGLPPAVSQVFNAAALSPFVSGSTDYNTGQNSITIGNITAAAFGSSARNVSFGQANEGIGTIGTGSNSASASTINSGSNEFIQFSVNLPARYFGIQLLTFDNIGTPERVRFSFFLLGSPVGSTIFKNACHASKANFTLDPGVLFDKVEVRPVVNGGNDSTLLVGSVGFCQPGQPTCKAPGTIPADDCP